MGGLGKIAEPTDPHDKLFRALSDDPDRARALLREHLPAEVVAELADTPPEPIEGNFVDAALQGSQSDRLFRVPLKVVVSLLADTPENSLLEWQVLDDIVRVYNLGERDLAQALDQAKPDRRAELMGTVADECMKRGEARGRAEGKAEGKAEAVLRILQARFGAIDDRRASRVRASDSAILDHMLERALTATRPDDVLDAADPA